jgi:hypothetical protein
VSKENLFERNSITLTVSSKALPRHVDAPGDGVMLNIIFSPTIFASPSSSFFVSLLIIWGLVPPTLLANFISSSFIFGTIFFISFRNALFPIQGKS